MLLFCVKTTVKQFELAHLKKKKKKKKKERTFWFGTFAMLFMPLGMSFIVQR